MPIKKIKILLVDDQELIRMGIKSILGQEPTLEIVGEAESGEMALTMAREKNPDVVLLDLSMPGMGGLETTKRLAHSFSNIKIIVVSSKIAAPYPTKLLQEGAMGFLSKDCVISELVPAIRRVMTGQQYVSAIIAQDLALRSVKGNRDESGCLVDPSLISTLSNRELQVLEMVGDGQSVSRIATQLNLSPKTVNTYRYRLYAKLGVKTDVELSHITIRQGLVDVEKGDVDK